MDRVRCGRAVLVVEEGFVEELPEDEFAREELLYGARAKCPAKGRRDKFSVEARGDHGERVSEG